MARHRHRHRRQRLRRLLRGTRRRTPPYRVYQLTRTVAYAFGTGSNLGERSTRYRFFRPAAPGGRPARPPASGRRAPVKAGARG
jgi:hypothetical protein